MKPAPIPPLTPQSLAQALGDVIRAAAVWGAEATQKDPDERTYVMVCQYAAQLYALVKRADPTDEELAAIFGQFQPQQPT